MRIEDVAERMGIHVDWRPFLLGPIFTESGWQTSPFNIYPQKGQYMWRDLERRSAKYGLAFQRLPSKGAGAFPQNGLHAARLALIGLSKGWGCEFCKATFLAQFSEGQDIGSLETVTRLAFQAGAKEQDVEAACASENKEALRAQTESAAKLGIFGAPSFLVKDELFWGDDRLEDALQFAQRP